MDKHTNRSGLKEAVLRLFFASACLSAFAGVGAVVSIYSRVDSSNAADRLSLLPDSTTQPICYEGEFLTGRPTLDDLSLEAESDLALASDVRSTAKSGATHALVATTSASSATLGAEIDDDFDESPNALPTTGWANELKLPSHRFANFELPSATFDDAEIALDAPKTDEDSDDSLYADDGYVYRDRDGATHTMRRFDNTASEVAQASVVTPVLPGLPEVEEPVYVADSQAHAVGSIRRGSHSGTTSVTVRLQ